MVKFNFGGQVIEKWMQNHKKAPHAMVENVRNDSYNKRKIWEKPASVSKVWSFCCNYP